MQHIERSHVAPLWGATLSMPMTLSGTKVGVSKSLAKAFVACEEKNQKNSFLETTTHTTSPSFFGKGNLF